MTKKDENKELALASDSTLKDWQKVTNEGEVVPRFKYLEGHPKQYRFDAKAGEFNINGIEKVGSVLVFQPIACRIFKDNILNMGPKMWAELFFIDEKDCVSAVLFHGFSVDNVFRLIEPLFYDDLMLSDVVVTATAAKKENTNVTPKGVYYIAEFSFKKGDEAQTKMLKDFAQHTKIYREETLTGFAEIKSAFNFHDPFAAFQDTLPEGE